MRQDEKTRVENLLGALSIGISDRIQAAAIECVGHAGETAAALVQIGTTPRISIEELSEALALSHSAVVRLVGKLIAMGHVERTASADKREVRLVLTRNGKAMLKRIQAARFEILSKLTAALSTKDVGTLSRLLEQMLERIALTQEEAVHVCRYCDEESCPQHRCPTRPISQGRAAE